MQAAPKATAGHPDSEGETVDIRRPLREVYDFVVLGAGVAGLAFAYEVTQRGKSVLLLEKDAQIGGLSRTLEYEGFRFDYCAHRFHSSDPTLIEDLERLVGPTFRRHTKRSRIFMFGRYMRYPFELQNLLRAMPKFDALAAGASFAKNWALRKLRIRTAGHFRNYKDWFAFHFGNKLYEVMCRPYTSKIWKSDPSLISADWADERFQGMKLRKLIGRILKKAITLDFSSYSLEDDSLAPDGGDFYYGDGGAQDIPDAYARHLKRFDTLLLSEVEITNILSTSKSVTFKDGEAIHHVQARERIVSTIPLHGCYELLDRESHSVRGDLEQLKYMDIIFVYLLLDKESVSNDHWLYFPDKDILFNRAVEFKNWSTSMCPPGKTALCLDITCYEGDDTWKMSDEALAQASIDGTCRAGLIETHEVFDTLVIRVKDAYPFYDLDYREKIERIVSFLEHDENLVCLGRTGIFKYNNSDGSIEMGRDLAMRLSGEESEKSVRGWRVKEVSY